MKEWKQAEIRSSWSQLDLIPQCKFVQSCTMLPHTQMKSVLKIALDILANF